MRKIINHGLSGVLACILIFSALITTVTATEHDTIRVGIFSLGKFMDRDENDNVCGYNIDFLNRIAEQTKWKYQYVDCENWITATEMLANGEIDLLAPAQITEQLSAQFSYATLYMGTETAAIYTKADQTDLLYEDFGKMNTLTFGVAQGSTFARKFKDEYCPAHNMKPNTVEYANTTELQTALANDEVDAIVTNIMFVSDDYKMLGWYSLMPVYYIARPDDKDMLADLDNAMMQILASEPDYVAQLERKYFPIFDQAHLTYEEKEFVKTFPAIKVGYETNHEPLSYTDKITGEFAGISRDILDLISEQSGIHFEYIALPSEELTFGFYTKNPERFISGEYLYEKVWNQPITADANALKSAIKRLRNKIEESDWHIVWSRGEGYCFEKE